MRPHTSSVRVGRLMAPTGVVLFFFGIVLLNNNLPRQEVCEMAMHTTSDCQSTIAPISITGPRKQTVLKECRKSGE
jgi:hypothetical protein